MELPSGTYLIRANPAAATLSFQELAAHLARAARGLRPPGQAAPNLAAPNLAAPNLAAPNLAAPNLAAPNLAAPGQALARKPIASNGERPTLEGP
jgi:hypothetical protein